MIDTDRYQPIFRAMKAEPPPVNFGQIIVDPSKI